MNKQAIITEESPGLVFDSFYNTSGLPREIIKYNNAYS